MSIERYLGAYYPIFHHTSVTRRRLLTLLVILLIVHTTLHLISRDDFIVSRILCLIIFIIVASIPPVGIPELQTVQNFQRSTPKKHNTTRKKNDNKFEKLFTCLLVVAFVVVLSVSILSSVYIVFDIICKNRQASNVKLYMQIETCNC